MTISTFLSGVQIFSLVGDISLWLGIFFYSVNVTHCKLRFQIFCLVGNFLQYFTISKISLTFEIFSLIENIFILQSLVYPRLAHCDLEAVLLRRSYSSINLNFCFNFTQFLCCDLRAVLQLILWFWLFTPVFTIQHIFQHMFWSGRCISVISVSLDIIFWFGSCTSSILTTQNSISFSGFGL